MAAPVVDSVVPDSASLTPGSWVDVVVTAHDPDSKAGAVTFTVSDSQGNVAIAALQLTVDDPISFGPGDPGGMPVTVQKISSTATSATYRVTAS